MVPVVTINIEIEVPNENAQYNTQPCCLHKPTHCPLFRELPSQWQSVPGARHDGNGEGGKV